MPQEVPTMVDQHIHSVSVTGIVVDEAGRVLVIQRRDNGHWEPPGGILERGETFEEGVAREVLEETGVQVEVEHLTGVYKNMTRGIVALVYRCRPLNGRPESSAEATQVRWVSPQKIDTLMTPAYGARILDAFASQTTSRAHDGSQLLTGLRPQPVRRGRTTPSPPPQVHRK
jgi:8-oxo-dGTP diphosphatase